MSNNKRTIYEIELQQIFKAWIFGFPCPICLKDDVEPLDFRYISPLVLENEEEGTYANSPTIWCGCNSMLYPIQSHGLYDLLDSLFERDTKTKTDIIIKLYDTKIIDDDPETFSYEIDNS